MAPRATTAPKAAASSQRTLKRTAKKPALIIKARMYRQGLGDCFLLTILSSSPGGRPFYVMIDCGVILGTEDAPAKMQNVVQDIIDTTGGDVDLVVATHQHWDHLSGFLQAKDLFAEPGDQTPGKLRIHDLWLAWTEDPDNRLANNLRARRGQRLQALRATVQQLRGLTATVEREAALGAAAEPLGAAGTLAEPIEELLGFFGAAAAGSDTQAALDALRRYARKSPRFCRPVDPPITLPEVPGVRFWVLGPPEDEKLLLQSDPSKKHPEVYEDPRKALDQENAFAAAFGGVGSLGIDPSLRELSLPFDGCYQIPVEQAKQGRFFQRHYYAEDTGSEFQDQSWRWIDGDWLTSASQLALQLDSDTNNTSLVLAIELTDSGKVLLFPADAQVGNWLSWGALSWLLKGEGREDQTVKTADLLSRTVLYKVGHHCSHNATLREEGLERMTSDALTALIPVNHDMAVKKRWNMPFPPLLQRLNEKTRGRMLRVDDKEKIGDRKAPEGVSDTVWQDFQRRVTEKLVPPGRPHAGEPLYVEIRIEG
jgi:hypothetical protein